MYAFVLMSCGGWGSMLASMNEIDPRVEMPLVAATRVAGSSSLALRDR
jgi:hypothetical protein